MGGDPRSPYSFACSEAVRRGIEVEKVPRGDVRLHGGRALYDPDALLILHEEVADEFIEAFLVAHEIGHVALGGGTESWQTQSADPFRASEAAPVGVERVIDYSHRERREIQMDLFAREFLLPRGWLRKLHLAGETAVQIATRCKAPHSIVAQQLFDALLLPTVDLTPSKSAPVRPLDESQRRAVKHRGLPFLLEAGPGTGKTQTLVGRVCALLGEGVVSSKILVLTFSNRAAGELSERISALAPDAVTSMWIGTFHGFGLDLVHRFHELLELPAEPKLLDRTDAIELLENEYPRLGLKYFKSLNDPSEPLGRILNAISRAKDEVVDAAEYHNLSAKMRSVAVSEAEILAAEKCLEVARVYAAYEALKKSRGAIDFGDLVALPVRLCDSFPQVKQHLQNIYEHVLVDEFQDVNRSSVRLLNSLTKEGANLWVVGDVKQSIYRFRGASSFNVRRFGKEDFPGGKRSRLSVNYRSVAEVRDTFVRFASAMEVAAGSDTKLDAERGVSGKKPKYTAVSSDDDEILAVAESIEEMRGLAHGYRGQAVLCAGNDRLSRFAEGLEQLGIPILYLGSLFERDEVKDLLSLLSLLVDRRAMGLVRIATMNDYAMSLSDVACILGYLAEHGDEALQWTKDFAKIPKLSGQGIDAIHRLSQLFEGFKPSATPWTVLATILLDRTRMVATIAEKTDVRSRARGIAIWQFMNFLRAQVPGRGLPIVKVLDRIRSLLLNSDDRDLRQLPAAAQSLDAVRLMTIHGSKGLQFPVVHIPGLTAASLPRPASAAFSRGILPPIGLIQGASGSAEEAVASAHVEEQECLFFVAISRARDHLRLYSPTQTANGRSRPRSPFIDRLGSTISIGRLTPKGKMPPTAGELQVDLRFDGKFEFSDYQLSLYERCPRRFFYTHILGIGGRRTESAFMRLHVAVQHVLDSIAANGTEPISTAATQLLLDQAWETKGPGPDGYGEEYKAIAWDLLQYFVAATAGMKRAAPPVLRIPVSGGEIIVTPDFLLTDEAGGTVFRRVRTGHKRSKEGNDLTAAAFHIAATDHSAGCTVELVHLADGEITTVNMSRTVLSNRKAKIAEMLDAVRSGKFPLDEQMTCPRCPAFFVCGSLPIGPLQKKFVR